MAASSSALSSVMEICLYIIRLAIRIAMGGPSAKRAAQARAAGARIEILDSEDLVETLLAFAKAQGITQIFIGHSQRSGIASKLFGSPVDVLIRRSRGMDIRVFPQ